MKCQVKRCKEESYLIFYGFGVCDSCWSKHCDGLLDLKQIFKVKDVNKDIKFSESVGIEIVPDNWKNYFKGV